MPPRAARRRAVPCAGARYQGGYEHGQPHGQAVYVSAEGEAFAEQWEKGQRLSRKPIGDLSDAMHPHPVLHAPHPAKAGLANADSAAGDTARAVHQPLVAAAGAAGS